MHRRHLPDRRAPSPPSADGLAGRGRTPAAGRTPRPGAVRTPRAGRAADRHPRRPRRPPTLVEFDRPPLGRQRVLRRGAGRRATRPAVGARDACPRPSVASSWSASRRRPETRRPTGRGRRGGRPRGRARRPRRCLWAVRRRDCDVALREAVDAQILVVDPGDRRALPIPSRPGPGGRLRRVAAVRATPPPRGLCAGDRPAPAGRRRCGRASRLVEIAHHWTAAHEPAGRWPAAIAAGDASRAVYAYAEAARQYEVAIELWDVVPTRPTGRPTATSSTCSTPRARRPPRR